MSRYQGDGTIERMGEQYREMFTGEQDSHDMPEPGIEIPTSANYGRNYTGVIRDGDIGPCVVCGRPVKDTPHALYLHVIDGGTTAITEAEEPAVLSFFGPAGDMGLQPIGRDCLQRHPELAQYVRKA